MDGIYSTGTITVNTAATSVVGSGTLWLAHVVAGDMLVADGLVAIIESVETNTGLTLAAGWPGGNLSGASYQVVQNSWLRTEIRTAQREITEFINLVNGIGVIYYVDDAEPDPDIGEDGQFALKANASPWQFWMKQSGLWVELPTPAGIIPRGAYAAGTTYAANDLITYAGSAYRSLGNGNIGHQPDISPTYWEIFVAKGATGAPGADGIDGDDGWSPELAVVADGARRVLQIPDWQGGSGTEPPTGKYIGPAGLVDTAAEGVDVRGAPGADGSGVSGGAAHQVALYSGVANISGGIALTDGQILVGQTGADPQAVSVSGDGTISSAGALAVKSAAGAFALLGDITPAQITADQNDYNPAGLSGASVLRLASDASYNLTGLSGGNDGRLATLINVGANNLVLKDESASSSAANRFSFGADVTLAPKHSAVLWYDAADSRWKLAASGRPFGTAAAVDVGTTANKIVQLDGSAKLPAVDGSQLTNIPGGGGGLANIIGRNGGLEVWQRGAGSAASIAVAASMTLYTADGWYLKTGANQAFTVSAQTGLVAGSLLCARVQRDNGQTGTGTVYFAFPLDADEVARLRGKTVKLIFTTATGANWSPAGGTLTYNLYCGTGAVAKRGASAYTGETNPLSGSVNLAQGASAAQTSATSSAVANNITQAEFQFSFTPAGTSGANDWLSIDDVQISVDGSMSSFEQTDFIFDLTRCQRHYWKSYLYSRAPGYNYGSTDTGTLSGSGSGAQVVSTFTFPRMRAAGTLTIYDCAGTAGKVDYYASGWNHGGAPTNYTVSDCAGKVTKYDLSATIITYDVTVDAGI